MSSRVKGIPRRHHSVPRLEGPERPATAPVGIEISSKSRSTTREVWLVHAEVVFVIVSRKVRSLLRKASFFFRVIFHP